MAEPSVPAEPVVPPAAATAPAAHPEVNPPESGAGSPEMPPVFTSMPAVRDLMASGDHARARAALMDNIAVEPANHTWRLLIGVVECQAGKYAQALDVFKQVVREDPTNAKAHVLLGAAYLGLGDLAVARDQVTMALEIDPELPEAHYDLARLCMAIDPPDRETALHHYERALRLGERRDPLLERQLQTR
jgi:Flp pilus assembly protein TadD